jgi:hypothetical protein
MKPLNMFKSLSVAREPSIMPLVQGKPGMEWVIACSQEGMDRFPPSDKPYLLSTVGQLSQDEATSKECSTKFGAEATFPGPSSSQQEKFVWLKALQGQYSEELEDSCYMTDAPEAHELAPRILLESCPEEIWAELHLKVGPRHHPPLPPSITQYHCRRHHPSPTTHHAPRTTHHAPRTTHHPRTSAKCWRR